LISIECNNGGDGSGCELGGSSTTASKVGAKFCVARQCRAGYYCPEASTKPTQHECGVAPQLSSQAQKSQRLPLQKQNITIYDSLSSKNKTVTVSLTNSTFSVLGSVISLYGANVYCPPSSVLPTPSLPGYYTIGPVSVPGRDNQQSQLDVNIRTAQVPCEAGYYCVHGIKYPCLPGTYGGESKMSNSDCSGLCSPGYICLTASSLKIQYPCGVDGSVYCPAGSYEAIPVPAGYYSIGGTSTTRSDIAPCEPGYYCINGVKYPCPAGRFAESSRHSSPQCDGLCASGYYCLQASSSPKQYTCPPGRYGTAGMINAFCKGSCLSGYYCPAASTLPYQNECGDDGVYCPHGSGSPVPTSLGYYSVGQNATIRVGQNVCSQSGKYYGSPPAADSRENTCPSNTK